MDPIFRFLPIAALILLSACASAGDAPPPVVRAGDTARQPTLSFPRASDQSGGNVVGRTASSLIALFGQPALDIHEGSARKLQFSGSDCVLDVYLYPRGERGEPLVTHVDARLPDGRDTDRETCIAALRRR